MSADKFLGQIEKLGIVDDKVLGKIRRQVANPDKNITARAVAKYLIEKGQLTKSQAERLMADSGESEEEATLPTGATRHEELVESQPVERAHDTDQLISVDEPEPVPGPSDATRMDFDRGPGPVEEEIIEVDLDDVHEISVDQVEELRPPAGADYPDPVEAGHPMDPFDDPFADHSGVGDPSVDKAPIGFAGKRTSKDPWKSKWLFIAPSIIGLLVIIGVLLYFWNSRLTPDELWKAANDAHVRGDYGIAMEQFDEFMDDYPNEDRFDLARVYRTRSLLAQSYTGKQWEETMRRAKLRLPEIETLPEFNEVREDLADILPNTALGFANQSLKEKDIPTKRKILDQANEAMELVKTPSYIPTKLRTRPITEKIIDEIEDKLREIRREITMEEEYVRVLDEIDSLTGEGKTNAAIEAYQSLTSRYPKLRPRDQLQKAIAKASDAERQNVKAFQPDFQASTTESPSTIDKTIILARQNGATAVGLENELIPFLVDGSVYMFRGGDGSIAWRRYVGYQTSDAPQWLDGGRTRLLVTSAETNELACVESETGKLVWRQNLDARFHQPKIVDGSVMVTTRDGQIIRFDSSDGSVAAAVRLPQETSVAADANTAFVYQPGMHTNLYVLSTADLNCMMVNFVGPDHLAGSIGVPPIVVDGHLLLLVNGGDYANLHVYRIEENGQKLIETQMVQRFTDGAVNTPMYRFERWVVLASDTGDLKLLEINKTEEVNPVSVAASYRFSVDDSIATKMKMAGMQHFMMAYSGRIWIGNRGLMRFRVRRSQQSFNRDLITNGNDNFLAPIVRRGDYALTVRRRDGSALASVSAIDPLSPNHKEVWRTDFSAPLAGSVIKEGDNHYAVSSQGDIFPITQTLMDQGYTGKPTSEGSKIIDNLLFIDNIRLGPGRRVFYGPLERKKIISVDKDRTTGATRTVELMAPADTPSCEPVALGDFMIVGSRKGQVVKTNPGSGQSVVTPFQPEVEPGKDIRWCRPTVLNETDFVIADGDSGTLYLLKATEKDIQRLDFLEHGNRIRSPLVKVGDQVLAVDFDGNRDRLVAFKVGQEIDEQLSTHELPSDYVAGPFPFESGVLLQLANNEMAYYEADQFAPGKTNSEPKWSLALNGDMPAGLPIRVGDQTVFAFTNGTLAVVDRETGQRVKSLSLGQPISGSPTLSGNNLMIGGRDGNIHILSIDKLK